ncbi:hypothetical protein SALCHL_006536 [Streptomyces albus subsp. chlorinus]|uniref:hypothetical protein n=1 Tax=Streptomyces albus TaxID=1888 RepID=UPI001FAC6923|nr:hypothetical protein [Streptomyces albus]
MRFAEDADWFADCPAVRDFDGVQVKMCHSKSDALSTGRDMIDTAAAVTGRDWCEFTPQWSHSEERLEPFIGQKLCQGALLEGRPAGRDVAAGSVVGLGVRPRSGLSAERQRFR